MSQNRKSHRKEDNPEFIKISAMTVCAIIAALILIIFLNWIVVNLLNPEQPDEPSVSDSDVSDTDFTPLSFVHFINVGQGDSELIVADDGSAMLIDCGESEYGEVVLDYLNNIGISRLDYIVATHPHSDHIGGIRKILSSGIEVGTVIAPKIPDEFTPTTKSYEKFLTAVDKNGCALKSAKNESFDFGSGRITIMASDYEGDNMNNYSVAVMLEQGQNSFLFTGDIEKEAEASLVERYPDSLNADVLKVAHHGSSTSSSFAFLDAVRPQYCVIECGDSSYNHPNPDIVDRLLMYTKNIYRTDAHGSVVFSVSNDELRIETEN